MRLFLTILVVILAGTALTIIWRPYKSAQASSFHRKPVTVLDDIPPHLGRVPINPSPPDTKVTRKPAKGRVALLDCIAKGESNNNPRAVSKSGTYRGLFQFDLRTWQSVGGTGDPIDASVEEQYHRAGILLDRRGTQPWPVVGRRCR